MDTFRFYHQLQSIAIKIIKPNRKNNQINHFVNLYQKFIVNLICSAGPYLECLMLLDGALNQRIGENKP
jgi:hypothetical protein